MKRKLVQQGASTLMVSLPAKWVKEHNLSKGAEVEVVQIAERLSLSAEPIETKRVANLKLKGLTESNIRTLITIAYRGGFDTIQLAYTSEKQAEILRDVIRTRLLGFDIVKKTPTTITVENITEPSEEHYPLLFRKVLQNIEELFKALIDRYEKGTKNQSDVEDIEERVQQYDNFCRRVIARNKFMESTAESTWTFLGSLVHAQRELYHMHKLPNPSTVQFMPLLKKCYELFQLLNNAFINHNMDMIEQSHALEKEFVYDLGYATLKKSRPENLPYIYHIMSAGRQFYLCNSPLFGIILAAESRKFILPVDSSNSAR